ncbi:MAG: FAD:protein FMN transferase [bacterium]
MKKFPPVNDFNNFNFHRKQRRTVLREDSKRGSLRGVVCLAAIAAALAAGGAGCSKRAEEMRKYEDTRLKMGTFVTVTLYGEGEERLKEVGEAAFAEIDRVNSVFSLYDEGSELSRLNRREGGAVGVSDEMAEMIERSVEISRATGGAFDVTMEPLVHLWREARESGRRPGGRQIAEAKRKTGYKKLRIQGKSLVLSFLESGMSLDFGAIAKGYAVERAAGVVREGGVESGLVNAGGDIRAVGAKPGGGPWVLGIQNPRKRKSVLLKVFLKDAAVATSGDYEQYFEEEGKGRHESHIIDPRTGHGTRKTISVTVIAPDAALADALATALSVLGPVEGLEVLEKSFPLAEALIVTPDESLVFSKGFKRYTEP